MFFGSDVFTFWCNGHTPLHTAAGRGRLEVVQLLLAARADVHKRNGLVATHCSPTALQFQSCTQRQRLFPPLTTHFLRREGFTPLHEAARHGDLRVVQLLVGDGADVNAVAFE